MKTSRYTADFETTTREEDCRVWGYGFYNIDTDKHHIGQDIYDFFNYLDKLKANSKIYFHNLKFDGEFIINYLFKNGYKHTLNRKLEQDEFSTLITDMGQFYTIKYKNANGCNITFIDSFKILPMSVEAVAKAFNLPIMKGSIDYVLDRPVGWEITPEEYEYILNDVAIMGMALKQLFDDGLTRLTASSNAFNDLKETVGKKAWNYLFPTVTRETDAKIREAYKGGWTYLKDEYKNTTTSSGLVYDVNSLYPYVMRDKMLPYDTPWFFKGKYEYDPDYPLYIQTIKCNFELKEGYLPTIQLKNNPRFIATQYLKSSNGEETILTLTSIDLKLFFEHYDVYDIEYFGGYRFKASNEILKPYIDKWAEKKIDAEKTGNTGQRTQSKLMMNSPYGKTAQATTMTCKVPVYEEGRVRYVLGEPQEKEPIYTALACFITAYARDITIRSAQQNYDRFIYADTDSIHLIGTDEPDNINIHATELGAWKLEYEFIKAHYIRAKTYIEQVVGNYWQKDYDWKFKEVKTDEYWTATQNHIACAGLPKEARKDMQFSDFKAGYKVNGKLQHKRVQGGAILVETTYEIKGKITEDEILETLEKTAIF